MIWTVVSILGGLLCTSAACIWAMTERIKRVSSDEESARWRMRRDAMAAELKQRTNELASCDEALQVERAIAESLALEIHELEAFISDNATESDVQRWVDSELAS